MITRRTFLGTSLGAGAALVVAPELLRAQPALTGALIQRAIPSTGEKLPVISGAVRHTAPGAPGPTPSMPGDLPAAREVLKAFLDSGGKVVSLSHSSAPAEQAGLTASEELGIQDKFFWTTAVTGVPPRPPSEPPPPKVDPAAFRAQVETKLAKFKVPKIDLVMVGAYAAAVDPTYLSVLRELKKEGRIRYIGVHHLAFPPTSPTPAFADLEAVMRKEPIDFAATDYHVGDRRVEQVILPLAQERKIGFIAHFTFDRGRLFTRASGTPLPDWAAQFDAKTWAQFFLKYVISHPAVTVARTGTTKAAHMLENIGGGIGRLPNEAMRKRMAEVVDALPPRR